MTTKRMLLMLAVVACCVTGAMGQTAVAPADAFNAMLAGPENQMMLLVKAMPAEKYGFAPSAAIFVLSQKTDYAGVRTFGALVIHVAQANYFMGAKLGGMKL